MNLHSRTHESFVSRKKKYIKKERERERERCTEIRLHTCLETDINGSRGIESRREAEYNEAAWEHCG